MVAEKPIRKSVSVMIPVRLRTQFQRILDKQGRSQNEAVEDMIRQYCVHHEEALPQPG